MFELQGHFARSCANRKNVRNELWGLGRSYQFSIKTNTCGAPPDCLIGALNENVTGIVNRSQVAILLDTGWVFWCYFLYDQASLWCICLLNIKVRFGGKDNCLRENPHKGHSAIAADSDDDVGVALEQPPSDSVVKRPVHERRPDVKHWRMVKK